MNHFNLLSSLYKNSNTNGNKSTILGYDNLVALKLLIFEKKLFRHYNTNLADFIDISYDEMINKLIDKTNIYGFESIIRSETFRAIIYSYISFPEKKKTNESRNTNINFIIFFFNRLFLYFSTNQLHLVIANSDNQKKYIYRIIISLKIAICHQESWEDYLKEPQIDDYWILAMLQEAILVNSLNIISRISNSFICNLPGCGDCITILKEHKNYFFFIECKLLKKRAKNALKYFSLTEVPNLSIDRNHSISKGKNKRNHLIQKLDLLIKDRYLSCYLSNWSEEDGYNVFSLILLEKKLNGSERESEIFNVWISNEDINLVNESINTNLKNILNKRVLNKNKSGNPKLNKLTINQLSDSGIKYSTINLSTNKANNKFFDLFITVKNTEKFFYKTNLLEKQFSLLNNESLQRFRDKRLQKNAENQKKIKDNQEKNKKNQNYENYKRTRINNL